MYTWTDETVHAAVEHVRFSISQAEANGNQAKPGIFRLTTSTALKPTCPRHHALDEDQKPENICDTCGAEGTTRGCHLQGSGRTKDRQTGIVTTTDRSCDYDICQSCYLMKTQRRRLLPATKRKISSRIPQPDLVRSDPGKQKESRLH